VQGAPVGAGLVPAAADPLLTGLGVLGLLSDAAQDRPVACLVDNAGWLDRPSAAALAFAARRLSAEGVVVLLAARGVEGSPLADLPAWPVRRLGRTQAADLVACCHPELGPIARDRVIERASGARAVADLTAQELQIARLAVAGGSNRAIAARVIRSHKTVEYHLHKIFAKLGISCRADLASLADEIRRGRRGRPGPGPD
jgi:DNA-binding CsgD family transcriptional regulator